MDEDEADAPAPTSTSVRHSGAAFERGHVHRVRQETRHCVAVAVGCLGPSDNRWLFQENPHTLLPFVTVRLPQLLRRCPQRRGQHGRGPRPRNQCPDRCPDGLGELLLGSSRVVLRSTLPRRLVFPPYLVSPMAMLRRHRRRLASAGAQPNSHRQSVQKLTMTMRCPTAARTQKRCASAVPLPHCCVVPPCVLDAD